MKTKYIYEFLRNKNLYEECEKYCNEQEAIAIQKQKAKPISKRQFAWKGHYTGCCYELSGDRFNHSAEFASLLNDEDMFPIDVVIPDIDDEQFDPETCIHLKDIKKFKKITKRFLDFVHGEPSEADRYYDWDSFGFSTNNEPSDDELIEWLGNIFINKTDVDDIDPAEWFAIPEF